MQIEKTLLLSASPADIWKLLLDPQIMASCVPGMQSVQVVSEDEYLALMQVKLSFINAKFKLRTRIVEKKEPHFLLAQGTGEDSAVASTLKQTTHMHLTETSPGNTELRVVVNVDLMGRMASLGLAAMKTKVDRLWEEFGENLSQQLGNKQPSASAPMSSTPSAQPSLPVAIEHAIERTETPKAPRNVSFFSRLFGSGVAAHQSDSIRIKIRRPGDTEITIDWPVKHADQCLAWLRELSK